MCSSIVVAVSAVFSCLKNRNAKKRSTEDMCHLLSAHSRSLADRKCKLEHTCATFLHEFVSSGQLKVGIWHALAPNMPWALIRKKNKSNTENEGAGKYV